MAPKTKIFLVTNDKKTIEHIDTVTQNGSPIEIDEVLSDVSRVQQYVERTGVTSGIVDIDPAPKDVLTDLEIMISENPQLCTIVVSENISQELILMAMQAGARHFLQKGSIHEQLSGVMNRLLSHAVTKHEAGTVLTVFSASGGCGATTVALNLANELRIKSTRRVLMIDLDRCYGAASAFLDVKSEYGIDDLLTYQGKIDRHLIQSSSCSYKEDFHVLLSLPGGAKKSVNEVDPESLKNIIHVCRQTYGYTVIDAPRLDEQTVKVLSELSDFTILVFQLTLKDVKFARSIISMFKDMGLSQDKIIPLANRFKKRGPLIGINDGKRVLGTENVYSIRSDWVNAMNCLNNAKTLAEAAPRSGIRKDFQKLVDQIQMHSSSE